MPSKIFSETGWLSGSTRVIGAVPTPPPPPPPPPVAGSGRTFVGMSALDQSVWGTFPMGDTVQGAFGTSGGTTLVNTSGYIDDARASGGSKSPKCSLIVRVSPGNANLKDASGFFVPALWKASFDAWKTAVQAVSGGETKLRGAVTDGTVKCILCLDDFTFGDPTQTAANAFARAVTYTELEDICHHVKVVRGWNWLPMVVRGHGTYLKSTATLAGVVRQYQYLDAGWNQYRGDLNGTPAAYIDLQWDACTACSLGGIGGSNILNGGLGTTPGWGAQHPDSSRLFGQSPTEVRATGAGFFADPRVCGLNWWSYGIHAAATTYCSTAAMQAALTDVYNLSVGRTDGPINIRGDLVAP